MAITSLLAAGTTVIMRFTADMRRWAAASVAATGSMEGPSSAVTVACKVAVSMAEAASMVEADFMEAGAGKFHT
jgi:hypothetical protein